MSLTAWAQEEKAKREAWAEIGRLKKRIAELESKLDEYARQDLVWFSRHEVKGLDQEQNGVIDLNKIKADAVREAMKNISNSLDWDWSHVSSYEYCELLKEYPDKLERGE